MEGTFTVHWEVGDGYVGKSRPQTTEIAFEDLEGLSRADAEDLIYEIVQEDFVNRISFEVFNTEEILDDLESNGSGPDNA